ncbi:MAG: hypothetical protein IKA72_05385 [Clostridia bacterium]|nr:hypothetical protein [Clostridia bacterium]
MTVKEVVILASELLGISSDVKAFLGGDASVGEVETANLLRAFNLVEHELALDYFPLFCEETLDVDSGRLYYKDLSRAAVRISSVARENGEKIPHRIFSEYMQIEAGRAVVKYAYTPAIKDIDGESDFLIGVSANLMALGLAAEYCFMNGLYAEAEAWDKKYRTEITSAYRARPSKSIKERRWI